jgi:hypothetical protein
MEKERVLPVEGGKSKSVPPTYFTPQGDFTDMRVWPSCDRLLAPDRKLKAPVALQGGVCG